MHDKPKNTVEFKVWGRYALFTDPLTKIGGEKCSYHIPTYEALKGIAKSIYWKPTIIWVIDQLRVMKCIRTQTKGTKPLKLSGGNDLSIYTFLADVEYQVQAHFEWNEHQPDLHPDRVEGKHFALAQRMLEKGGRQDIFLGTRDCQGYVAPCTFGSEDGHHDGAGILEYALMFHGFDYPDETGKPKLEARFWRPTLVDGVIKFLRPEDCTIRKIIRDMTPKRFGLGRNIRLVEAESRECGV